MARRDDMIAEEMEELRAVREELEAEKRALEDELVETEEKWEKERAEREREGKLWAGRVEDAERVQARAVDELEQASHILIYRTDLDLHARRTWSMLEKSCDPSS